MKKLLLISISCFLSTIMHVNAQKFGIYSENPTIVNKLDFSATDQIKNVSGVAFSELTDTPFEGTTYLRCEWDHVGSYMMLRFAANPARNLSDFENGYLHFNIRTITIKNIGIRISDGNVYAQIWFIKNDPTYDFPRNGEWQQISIPVQNFKTLTPTLNLKSIIQPFVLRPADNFDASTQIDLDDIYFSNTLTTNIEISNDMDNLNFKSYPNPASNNLYLENRFEGLNAEIYSVTGQKIRATRIDNHAINIVGLTSGIYFLKINAGNKIYSNKFIKQ